MGFKAYKRPRRQDLTEKQKRQRLSFCKTYESQEWSKVICTDEHRFTLSGRKVNPQHNFEWVPKRQQLSSIPQSKYAPQFMAWGGISCWGPSPLIEIKGNMDSTQYQTILTRRVLPWLQNSKPNGDYLFQQDNARSHTAAATLSLLRQREIPFIPPEEWPANSPDLNPIENLWAFMDDKLSQKRIRKKGGLITAARQMFSSFTRAQLKKYILSMDQRVAACIKAKGGLFKI